MVAEKIIAHAVHKTFGAPPHDEVVALEEVSFSVNEGEFVSIVGPSGCGKSTFLYMVAGFIEPTKGEILLDGQRITAPGDDRGIVFQEYALFNWRTTIENVMYGLEVKGLPKAERRETAQRFLDFVGLHGFERSYPRQLSGGMK